MNRRLTSRKISGKIEPTVTSYEPDTWTTLDMPVWKIGRSRTGKPGSLAA